MAAKTNKFSQVFKILRRARVGHSRKTSLVKDKEGHIINNESDCISRWMEHFINLLHHPPVSLDRDLEASSHAAEPSLECSTDPVTVDEVKKAVQLLKNNRAPGICKIMSEMLKAGGINIIWWLTHIINEVWHSEKKDWAREIILPFWKRKGDKLVCSNYRGITLLSIPGKVLPVSYSIPRSQQSVATGSHSKPVSCQTAQRSTRYLLFAS